MFMGSGTSIKNDIILKIQNVCFECRLMHNTDMDVGGFMYYSEDIFKDSFQAVAFNMKKLRDKYALTQKEMSSKLNIDPQYYARLERGDDPKRKFTLEKVFLACALFKVQPNFNGDREGHYKWN